MRLLAIILGFILSVCLLITEGRVVCAAEISGAEDVVAQKEEAYYTLIDPQRYTLIHEVKLANKGMESAYGINVRVALMDKPTPLYTNRLREQLLPWPDSITTDEYGRRVAYYHFEELPAGKELLFTQKYVLEYSGISYPKLSTPSQFGYEGQLASQYLLPSPGIESDNEEIIAFAKQATEKERDTFTIAQAAFAAVNLYMTYVEDDIDSPNKRGALRALHRASGVCEDYSKLYVAVLRALGIAARQQSGYLYLPAEHNKPPYVDEDGRLNFNLLRHAWAEFYLPGKGWVIADPTFTYSFEIDGQTIKYINWDYFAAITDERRYIFFREETLNEDKLLYFNASKNGDLLTRSIDCYMLPGSQAACFNDLEGHWAKEFIMRLAERDEPLLQGLGNGMFGVDDPLTRAQLVACLQRYVKSPAGGPNFTDLFPSHWAYGDIGAAQHGGWINGYPNGSFRPDNSVTRAEVAQILVDVFKLSLPVLNEDNISEEAHLDNSDENIESNNTYKELVNSNGIIDSDIELTELLEENTPSGEFIGFLEEDIAVDEQLQTADDENIHEIAKEDAPLLIALPQPGFLDIGQPGNAWADEAITTLFTLGYAIGDGNGYYQPSRPVTRAEFAALLDRIILKREKDLEEAQATIEDQILE